MLILSLDSASAGCGACVWHEGKVIAEATEPMDRGQDQRLVPLINSVMEKAGIEYAALDRIAVTRGPGSFTGLRIGLAAARGIGLASGKPVIGIDRFAIYREQIRTPGKSLLAVIESKRAELFCRFYPVIGVAHEPQMLTQEEILTLISQNQDTIVTGDIKIARTAFEPAKKKEIVTCAALAAKVTPGDVEFLPRPLYIREPDVTFPRTAKA